jgi:hypothetical protein
LNKNPIAHPNQTNGHIVGMAIPEKESQNAYPRLARKIAGI